MCVEAVWNLRERLLQLVNCSLLLRQNVFRCDPSQAHMLINKETPLARAYFRTDFDCQS